MKLTINHHFSGEVKIITSDGETSDLVLPKLNKLLQGQERIMATINDKVQELLEAVSAEGAETRDVITGYNTLVETLRTRIAELEAQQQAGELTDEQIAQFDALKASIQSIYVGSSTEQPENPEVPVPETPEVPGGETGEETGARKRR